MSPPLTYKGANPKATLADCPICGQAARVELRGGGKRIGTKCYGGCEEADVLEAADVEGIRGELLERAQSSSGSRHADKRRRSANGSAPDDGRTIRAEDFASIRAEPTRWLWEGRVPLGTATLLVGREKLGKSTLTTELAAQLSRGTLEGDLAGHPAATMIVTYEDSAGGTIKPRLVAASADVSRVHRVSASRDGATDLVSLPADVEELGALAAKTEARLVIVDPLSASLGADVDGHRDQDIRRALAPLVALAERQGLAVLCLAHFNKSQGGDALSRVLGSRGLTAAVRSVLTFGRAPDAEEDSPERVLAHAASNLSAEAPSLAYRHEGREVQGDGGELIPTNRLVLLGECETRADELITIRSEDERTDAEAAADWLADELADGSWRESGPVKERAKAAGYSVRTLQRAKQRLGVEDRREGFASGGSGQSEWRLPTLAPAPAHASGASAGGASHQTRMDTGFVASSAPARASTQDSGASVPDEDPLAAGERLLEEARQRCQS